MRISPEPEEEKEPTEEGAEIPAISSAMAKDFNNSASNN